MKIVNIFEILIMKVLKYLFVTNIVNIFEALTRNLLRCLFMIKTLNVPSKRNEVYRTTHQSNSDHSMNQIQTILLKVEMNLISLLRIEINVIILLKAEIPSIFMLQSL